MEKEPPSSQSQRKKSSSSNDADISHLQIEAGPSKSIVDDLTSLGKVTMQGKNVSFLASDFIEQLQIGATSSSSARSSFSSRHRSRSDIPEINPGLIDKLEQDCVALTKSVDDVLTELTTHLHEISAISVANTQACSERISELSSHADNSVHTMYSLLAHMEELDEAVKPIYALAMQISSLKDIVVMLENYMH